MSINSEVATSPAAVAQVVNGQQLLAVDLGCAAGMVGVSAKTLRREIERGHLRGLKIGRQWRVRIAELNAYLRRQESAS